MYRIAVLTEKEARGRQLSEWVRRLSAKWGLFPTIEHYEDVEGFFHRVEKAKPDGVILEFPGISGLNTAEHLHSLCPGCRIIWCSDLDFSLQAYRFRAVYFMLYPATEEELQNGLSCWYGGCGYRIRPEGRASAEPENAVAVNINYGEEAL